MDSMDNVRERIEVLERRTEQLQQQTRTAERRQSWWLGIACGVLLLSLVSLAPLGQAADFACAAGDVVCLITAINTANANGEANTITLEAGTYTLTTVDNTTDGANGLPSVTSTLTIRGAGADPTILERDASAPLFRLLHVAAAGALTLKGLTVRGGNSSFFVGPLAPGGGLRNQGGTVRITETTFANHIGTGISNSGILTLRKSLVADNSGSSGFGGPGGIGNAGTLLITQSAIVGNRSFDAGGGLTNSGTGTIIQSTIARNNAAADPSLGGGGILNFRGTLTIANSAIVDNDIAAGGGGGISNDDGVVIIHNSTLARNRAFFFIDPASGGAIANRGSGQGTVSLTNSTIAANGANGAGGGIFNGNGTVTMLNTFLAQNNILIPKPPAAIEIGPSSDCTGSVISLDNNLIGDPTGCTITLRRSDLTGDPGLDTFTDNGRPGNGHFPLPPASQAIDAGNTAVCPRKDQIGQRRIGRCDIGAIRFLDNADLLPEDDPATAAQASR